MGGEKISVDYQSSTVIGSDGGRIVPTVDAIEGGSFPNFALTDQTRLLVRGYRSSKRALWLVLLSVVASVVASIYESRMIVLIVAIGTGILIFAHVAIAKTALSEAIDSEAERHDEIENYRRLSDKLCLRSIREGRDNG